MKSFMVVNVAPGSNLAPHPAPVRHLNMSVRGSKSSGVTMMNWRLVMVRLGQRWLDWSEVVDRDGEDIDELARTSGG